MTYVLTLIAVLQAGSPNLYADDSPGNNKASKPKIGDGFYAVLKSAATSKELGSVAANQRIIEDVRAKRWGGDDAHRFLLLKAQPDVPLELAGKPTIVQEGSENAELDLRLSDRSAAQFSVFTKKHLGKAAALLIKGEVLMVARIRDPIQGKLRLSFCGKLGAKHLQQHLTKQLKNGKQIP